MLFIRITFDTQSLNLRTTMFIDKNYHISLYFPLKIAHYLKKLL